MRQEILVVLLVLGGCASVTAGDRSRVKQECRAVLDAQVKAWNRGDLEAFVSGYSRSADLTFVGKTVHRGHRSLLERYRAGYPDRDSMGTLRFVDLDVVAPSEDHAFLTGEYRLEIGETLKRGRFTLLMRREAGTMRIVYDHTSELEDGSGARS